MKYPTSDIQPQHPPTQQFDLTQLSQRSDLVLSSRSAALSQSGTPSRRYDLVGNNRDVFYSQQQTPQQQDNAIQDQVIELDII